MLNQLAILLLLSWSSANDKTPYPEIASIHDRIQMHYNSNLDSAHVLATQAVFKSKELGDDFGLAKSQFILGMIENKQGKVDQAVTYFLDALKNYLSIENPNTLSDQAKICMALGKVYRQHHRIRESIEFYERGLEFALKANNQKVYLKLLHNMSVALHKNGEEDKAISMLLKKLEIISNDDLVEKNATYNQLGLVYTKLKMFNKAIAYYNQMIEPENNLASKRSKGQAYHNLANLYQEQGKYKEAKSYYLKALAEKEPLGNPKDLFITYQDIARLFLLEGDTTSAITYAKNAIPLLTDVPKTPEYYSYHLLLSRCYRRFDPEQSYKNTDLYADHNDAFLSLQKELIELGEGYKMDLITATYFHEQRQHQQRMRLYWTISCGFIFLLIAGLVSQKLWRIYSYKSPQASLELIKNQQEMIYLFDLLRKEKAEIKNTIGQQN